jgi:hypothetical protein
MCGVAFFFKDDMRVISKPEVNVVSTIVRCTLQHTGGDDNV